MLCVAILVGCSNSKKTDWYAANIVTDFASGLEVSGEYFSYTRGNYIVLNINNPGLTYMEVGISRSYVTENESALYKTTIYKGFNNILKKTLKIPKVDNIINEKIKVFIKDEEGKLVANLTLLD
jgi:hypothetical protein